MKKFFSLLALLAFSFGPANAQKIVLKIASITPAAGEEVKAAEFKVEFPVVLSGGAAGKPVFKDFLIKKSNGTSSNELYKKLLTGVIIPVVMIEYYDAANNIYFIITLKQVSVSNFYWLSPECPTCLKLEHQVGFVGRQIETYDVSTGVTVKFDVILNSIYL